MKKLALLLAVLMLVSLFAACKKKDPAATGGQQAAAPVAPVFQVPGHQIDISLANGWKAVAEDAQRFQNQTYLELTNGSATLLASAYGPGDTVDPIPAEDIMAECNTKLFASMKELSVKEDEKTHSVSGKDILSARYSAKEGDTTKEFYCLVVSFTDGSECQVWLCFIASSDYMGSNKDTFKGYAESMTCSEGVYTPEDEPEFDEYGEPITDDPEFVEDTEDVTGEETAGDDENAEPTGEETEGEGGEDETPDTTGEEETPETTGEDTESAETTAEATSTATTE